jgi:hypothetical protein
VVKLICSVVNLVTTIPRLTARGSGLRVTWVAISPKFDKIDWGVGDSNTDTNPELWIFLGGETGSLANSPWLSPQADSVWLPVN